MSDNTIRIGDRVRILGRSSLGSNYIGQTGTVTEFPIALSEHEICVLPDGCAVGYYIYDRTDVAKIEDPAPAPATLSNAERIEAAFAARKILGGDASVEDVIALASYITGGAAPTARD